MYLIGKDYVAPEKSSNTISTQKKTSIKTKIKELCPADGRVSYEEIVKEVQKDENFTNDQIISVIEEVKTEKDYKLPEPEPEPEPEIEE